MDLNLFYSQHQRSIMNAGAATSRIDRTRHLAAAGLYAHRIADFQLKSGAAASRGWIHASGQPECS